MACKKKKPKKFSEGGWATSVSFNAEDAKRRAEQWAKEHPPQVVARPAPAPRPAPVVTVDRESPFMQRYREEAAAKEIATRNRKAPTNGYIQSRTMAISRDNDMMPSDAPSALRKQVFGAAASIPLAAGLGALGKAPTGGFVGKGGQEALKGLAARGRAIRAAATRRANEPIGDVVRRVVRKGAGYAGGGKVKKFSKGGKVDDLTPRSNLPDKNAAQQAAEAKKKDAKREKYNDLAPRESLPTKKYAKGGAVRGCGKAYKGKNFKMR